MSANALPLHNGADDRQPPQDLTAEQSVLGGMLLSADAIADVVELLRPDDFYRPSHQTIYQCILDLHGRGSPADTVTTAAELERRGDLIRLGGAPYIFGLIQSVPTAANAAYYAEIVAEKAVLRRLVEAGTRIVQLGYTPDGASSCDLVERARQTMESVALSSPAGLRRGRQLRVTLASDVVPRRLRWLWEGRIILGGLTLLAGREGLGKSTVACDVTAQITRGVLDGELKGEPRTVVYIHSEDARDYTLVPRLLAAGANLDRVIFIDAITRGPDGDEIESPVVLPVDTALLADLIREHDAALVVLDAATSVIDSKLDGDRDRQMRQGLEAIARGVGEATGCAVLGVVHFGKRESADTGKLILGSIAWSQVARSVLAVAQDDETGDLVLSLTKGNLSSSAASLSARIVSHDVPTSEGTTQVGRVEWLGETTRDARDLLGSDDRSEHDEAAEWLREFLVGEGGSAPAGEVLRAAQKVGLATRTVQRARKRAGVSTRKEGANWSWSLEGANPGSGLTSDDAKAPTDTHVQGSWRLGALAPSANPATAPAAKTCNRCHRPTDRLVEPGWCLECSYHDGETGQENK